MIVVIYIVLRQPPVCAGEPVIIAKRVHPFPSRTRSLSSSAPMILWGQPYGKIGHRRFTRPHRRFFHCFHPSSFLMKTPVGAGAACGPLGRPRSLCFTPPYDTLNSGIIDFNQFGFNFCSEDRSGDIFTDKTY